MIRTHFNVRQPVAVRTPHNPKPPVCAEESYSGCLRCTHCKRIWANADCYVGYEAVLCVECMFLEGGDE